MKLRAALFFDDMTEFYAVRGGIDDCLKHNIDLDIIVPKIDIFNNITEDTCRDIRKLGYKVLRKPRQGVNYKVILEPYGVSSAVMPFNYIYRIKYRYGLLQLNKPKTLEPEWNILYDAIMSSSKSEIDFLGVYSQIELVEPTNFRNFKRLRNKHDKKRLLILPTFGDVSCVDYLTDNVIRKIKEKYYVIVKSHHAIQFRDEERERYNRLKAIADEFYDQNTTVANLLKNADVVISDASGAIFDAIYTDTPLVIFSNDLTKGAYAGVEPIQASFVEQGLIKNAKHGDDILPMMEAAERDIASQISLRHKLFDIPSNEKQTFYQIVQKYMNRDEKSDIRKKVHDLMLKRYAEGDLCLRQQPQVNQQINELNKTVNSLRRRVMDMEGSTSWMITKPLRRIGSLARRIRH